MKKILECINRIQENIFSCKSIMNNLSSRASEKTWEILKKESELLIDEKFLYKGNIYTFFGLVHGKDDFYYGMIDEMNKTILLSCVVNLETHGFIFIQGDLK